jgi:hypothetical protein
MQELDLSGLKIFLDMPEKNEMWVYPRKQYRSGAEKSLPAL